MDPLDRVRVADNPCRTPARALAKRGIVRLPRACRRRIGGQQRSQVEELRRLCPETWRICQNIPGLITVLFSILEPGKHMPAHRGPYNGVLRLHLGLIVPEPPERLGIRVENQIYRWREGEVVIFDTGKICNKAAWGTANRGTTIE